jgi:hypothetical protein
MSRTKTFLLISAVLAFSFLMVGCGLVGSWRASSGPEVNRSDEVPDWLTTDHRAQGSEEPVIEPDEDSPQPEPGTVPSVNQPAATQPAQQPEQQIPAGGTPRWQQPGTMEYIAKMRLDQLVFNYKRLNSEIVELEAKTDKSEDEVAMLKAKKKDRENLYKNTLVEIAAGIGLNLEKEYGIKPPPVDVEEKEEESTWFQNWEESPSGFPNQ